MESSVATVDPVEPGHWANRMVRGTGEGLRRYHRHAVRGLEHLTSALDAGRRADRQPLPRRRRS
jgi:hypothetical protein